MILIAYPPTLNCACVLPSPEMNSLARILFGWGRSSFHPILILASYLPNSSYWRTRCFQFLSLLRILQCNWGWFSAVRIAFLWFGFLRFTRVNMYPFAFQLTKVCIFFFFLDFLHPGAFHPLRNTITIFLLEFWVKVKLNIYVHSVILTSSAEYITHLHSLDYWVRLSL